MDTSLQDRLTGRLSGVLGMGGAADELTLARTDRKQLGTKLLHTLAGEYLLAPADVCRVIPRQT